MPTCNKLKLFKLILSPSEGCKLFRQINLMYILYMIDFIDNYIKAQL